ncbi:MAG TPA: hypothetical protein PKV80_20985 [Leptospiraceae bacterium]|nr:hypothetical protein [Leptospiraceae bacterium]HNM02972.1 hypothetical protein [Leptospiraceae bacterium]
MKNSVTFREKLLLLKSFIRTRWFLKFSSAEKLRKYQNHKIQNYLNSQVSEFEFYRSFPKDLSSFPVMEKEEMLRNFHRLNRFGIKLEDAERTALQAEQSRDFSPTINGITVGLSSGTSGRRGVFLASSDERFSWAGIILAKALSSDSLLRVLNPFASPLRIAFFLRANSSLYTTVKSRRIQFEYFDMTKSLIHHVIRLLNWRPHILIAPSSLLSELAENYKEKFSALHFDQVISVAEVLDEHTKQKLEKVFRTKIDQIYQCTEGFLGNTCSYGSIHLNEEFVFFEKEWIDEERFYPIITDFTRNTQGFIRFRLNDILKIKKEPCPCGNPAERIRSIEGRSDEILYFTELETRELYPVFPDTVRQIMYTVSEKLQDYRIIQKADTLIFFLKTENEEDISSKIISAFSALSLDMNLRKPAFRFEKWFPQPPEEKKKRIRRI